MNKKNFKVLIIACWVVLAICLVIKLFGGNWFELSTENTKFIEFCQWVDNNIIIKRTIACVMYIFTTSIALCMIMNCKKLSKKYLLIFIPIMIAKSVVSWYINWLSYIIDFFIIILIPLLIKRFQNWKRVILVNVIVLCLQIITLITRNLSVGFGFNENSTLISMLYQIDYIIMLILCYIYNIRYFTLGGTK